MSKPKKLRAVLVSVLVLALLSGVVLAAAATGGWVPAAWGGNDADIKYEKPSLNEVAGEGVEPGPLTPEESAVSTSKMWYEYITYSAEPMHEKQVKDNMKLVYYDPYDYNYGSIMEINDTNVASMGGMSIPCPFSSANELDVTWSTSTVEGSEWSSEFGLEIEQTFEYGALVTMTTGIHVQLGHTQAGSKETEQGVEMSQIFSAVHCNANGVPYQWKVVHYTVFLPVKVEIHKLGSDGQYIVTDTKYIQVPTVQGTCREYIINGVTYIEDWRTGDGVPLDDFWDDFMTPAKLEAAYANKLLPNS